LAAPRLPRYSHRSRHLFSITEESAHAASPRASGGL